MDVNKLDELEALLAQLKTTERNASFGTASTSVRVKDAPYLIEMVEHAAATIRAQAEEIAALKAELECWAEAERRDKELRS